MFQLPYDFRCNIYLYIGNLLQFQKVNKKLYRECIEYLYDYRFKNIGDLDFLKKVQFTVSYNSYAKDYRCDCKYNPKVYGNFCEKQIIPGIMIDTETKEYFGEEYPWAKMHHLVRIVEKPLQYSKVRMTSGTTIIIKHMCLLVCYRYRTIPELIDIGYPYIIYKVLEIIDLYRQMMYIDGINSILNQIDKDKCDLIWKKVCESYNWPFYPTK
jgi:hypothetical protein